MPILIHIPEQFVGKGRDDYMDHLFLRNKSHIREALGPYVNEALSLTCITRVFGIEMVHEEKNGFVLVGFLLEAILDSDKEFWDPMDVMILASELGWEASDEFWNESPYLIAKSLWEA